MELASILGVVTPIGALVGFVLYVGHAISGGEWIPGKLHDRVMKAKDDQIAILQETTRKLLENDDTIIHLLQALPKPRHSDEEVSGK